MNTAEKISRIVIISLVFCFIVFIGRGCVGGIYKNKEYLVENAESRYAEMGFKVIGYYGWQSGFWLGGKYGSPQVWYLVEPIEPNGLKYKSFLSSWGEEIHVYNLQPIDAIAVMNKKK